MRLIVISLATVVALAACTEPAPPASDIPAPAPSGTTPTPPSTNEPPAPTSPADECGAAERQDWVGRARSSLPSAPAGAAWRIFETGQPVTQDYRPNRLNIEINPDSQAVVRLSCG